MCNVFLGYVNISKYSRIITTDGRRGFWNFLFITSEDR